MAERSCRVFGPGEGQRYEARGSVMHFKAGSLSTGGRFSLMERTLPPGGRMPPPHVHVDCDEAYYVLDGRVTFILEGVERTEGAETFVLVPGDAAHTFGNRSAAAARLLVLHSPPLDGYFAALDALWRSPRAPSVEDERALMSRFGMRPAKATPRSLRPRRRTARPRTPA
ncbi:MAG TPA: cupin domain-containing protein [Dehalococcoidia bacterium]|nr:cupin domain-containing protein [Dehalococcoidia bacterium]